MMSTTTTDRIEKQILGSGYPDGGIEVSLFDGRVNRERVGHSSERLGPISGAERPVERPEQPFDRQMPRFEKRERIRLEGGGTALPV